MTPKDTQGVAPGSALILRPENALSTHVLAPNSAALDDSLHLRDLIRIILKRKWWIVSATFIVLLLVVLYTLLVTPVYRGSVTLQLDKNTAQVVDYKDGAGTQENRGNDDREFLATQYELLKSRALAERVMETLRLDLAAQGRKASTPLFSSDATTDDDGLLARMLTTIRKRTEPSVTDSATLDKEEILRRLQRTLTVEPVRNSRLVRVHLESTDPALAAKLANTWALSFIATNLERRFEASSYAKTFLEQQLAKTKEKLEDSERAFNEYTRQKQIVNVDEKVNLVAQNLTEFTVALARAEQERIKVEAAYDEVKRNIGNAKEVIENKTIALFKENKVKLEAEYQDQLRVYKPGFPKMQQIQAQIDELDKKIRVETTTVAASVESTARAAFLSAKAQESQLRSRADNAKRSVLDLQDQGIRYNILKREVDTNREIYSGLLQRFKEVGVAGGLGTNNISVVDKAETPLFPFKPDLLRNALIGLILGLMAGIALAFVVEYMDDSIKFPDEIERFTGLALLSVIPKVNVKSSTAYHQATKDPRSALAEAYRSLRTSLQFSTAHGAPRSIVVTSCTKNEGKSTTALSLAVALSQTGKRVLLVDADMRNPTLHRMLEQDHAIGLSNLLSSDVDPVSVTRPTEFPNVYFISAGPLPPNPVELLSGAGLQKLLDPAASIFDHIVIDAPPVLGIADSIVLSNRVDACLFVVASASTRKASIRNALKRLNTSGVMPLGAVLTKLGKGSDAYGYDQDYYYYYGSDAPASAKVS